MGPLQDGASAGDLMERLGRQAATHFAHASLYVSGRGTDGAEEVAVPEARRAEWLRLHPRPPGRSAVLVASSGSEPLPPWPDEVAGYLRVVMNGADPRPAVQGTGIPTASQVR